MPTKTKNVMLVLHRWQDQPLSFPPDPSSSCNFFLQNAIEMRFAQKGAPSVPAPPPGRKNAKKLLRRKI